MILAAILPYIAGIDGELLFDDVPLIKDDPFYLEEANPLQCWNRSFWKIEQTQGLYRPLTLFTYWVDIRLYSFLAHEKTGLFEPGFRITNLLLHLLITLLVFKLAMRLRFGRLTAFLTALIYALHPIHVEAVTPAFGRGELLCCLFMLAGLILHTYRKRSFGYVIGAALCYMLSFMAKENGSAYLPICILMEIYMTPLAELKQKQLVFKKLIPFSVYVLVPIGVFCLRKAVLGTWLPAKQHFLPVVDNVIALSSPLLRIVAAIRIQGIALIKFFWPSVLSYDYSYARIIQSETVWDPYAWLTLISFIAVPGLFIYFKPKYTKKILFLCLVYLVAILPAGNFIVPAGTIFAERLQYLPSVFLCFFASLILFQLAKKIPAKAFIILLILVSCALISRTFIRTFVWENDMTLCVSGIKSAPESIKVWNNISVQLADVNDFKGAIMASSRSIEIFPDYANGYANRGGYYGRLGMFKEAKEDLRKALKLSLNHLHANFTLGMIYAEEGYPLKAKMVWERIQKFYPRDQRLKDAIKLANDGKWGPFRSSEILELESLKVKKSEK